MTNKHAIHKQFTTHYSLLTNFAVLDYSGTHSLNAHTNCISNFNIRNRLFALTSFARQSLASLLSQNNSLNCFVRQSRKSAFTLAETLIVMGIIGVVAALTLPNLNSSTGDKEKVVKLKKIYSNLEDAIGRAQAVYGPYSEWNYSDSNDKMPGERITEFMRLSKNCEQNTGSNCFTNSNSKYLDGSNNTNFDQHDGVASRAYRVITTDGTSVLFDPYGGRTIVDIDGPNKGSNTAGKDIFEFTLNKTTNELIPLGRNYTDEQLKNSCFKNGSACTAWVIQNENLDYLKCPSTLSWTNTTCK